MLSRLAAALVLVTVFVLSCPEARAAAGGKDDACVVFLGPHAMRLAGYQASAAKAEYCGEIPKAGTAVLALEALEVEEDNRELRSMKAEIRVIPDVGAEAEAKAKLEDITEAYMPPASLSGGIVNFQHDFSKPGNYIALITVRGEKNTWVARYPLAVGVKSTKIPTAYLVIGGGILSVLLVGGLVQYVIVRENKKKKQAA